jgi:sigma-B regulation protein RsbU (phosphoserine phosphatase)
MPGWEVAAMYRPAGEVSQVGGDFYEAFEIDAGWVVVLGDVSGHGATAASLTSVARHTIRTATAVSGDPATGLRVLDERLRERDVVALCSVAVLLLPREDNGPDVEMWLAGHPQPFLLHNGWPRQVGPVAGPLVGIGETPGWPSSVVALATGDQLILYTDGVIEARPRDGGERFGVDRLRQRLATCDDPHAAVARVESALTGFAAEDPDDDAAVVAIRRSAAPGPADEEVGAPSHRVSGMRGKELEAS